MSSVNKAIIIGRVGKDPEVRYTSGGKAVCSLSVATSQKWKDKQGEAKEETEWHRVVAYDKLAEIIGEYVKKGGLVYIEGKMKTRKWQDKEGVERYTTEVTADQMQMLGGKQEESEPKPQAKAPPKTHGQMKKEQRGTAFDDMDNDAPF